MGSTGQTKPGSTVTLVETGQRPRRTRPATFAFYPVNLPNLGALHVHGSGRRTSPATPTLARDSSRASTTRLPSNLLPPDVTLNVSETTARVGDTVTSPLVTATHDGQPLANEVLLINGNQVALSPPGTATFSSVTPGVFTVVVKAFDAEGNEGDATQTITFLTPPNGQPAPVAGFNETSSDAGCHDADRRSWERRTRRTSSSTRLQYSLEGTERSGPRSLPERRR